ncbi:MAG TPA: MBL fold metallo-hydrolase [Oceanobacillus sp.]|nr:MBL fold metallo-hydrolase [Oceanobacillus sp.]
MISIGDIHIHLIHESLTLMDAGGPFGLVPRALWKHMMPPDDDNLVPMVQNNLLVQVGGRNIMVDTGLGTKLPEKLQQVFRMSRPKGSAHDALARLGLTAEDIDLVIDTHLHNDHCGGNTYYAPDGSVKPCFPNAEYVVQRREYEDAMRPNERTRATYIFDNYKPLVESGQMRLLDGDCELAPGIWGVVTPGHTPGHMSVRFESNGEHGMFVCDMASFAIHFERLGWMTAYDVEPLVTLETKRKWQQWALETNALLFFPHDPQRPVGRFTPAEDGKPTVVPVEVEYV